MGRNRRPERGIRIASQAVREAETDAAPETAAGDGGGEGGVAKEPGAQPELPTPPSAGGGTRARTAA